MKGSGVYQIFAQNLLLAALSSKPLKLVDKFTYLERNISSTESDVNTCIGKVWTVTDKLLVIWKFGPSDKMKWYFFYAVAKLVLLYRCTTWTLTNCIEKRLDGSYTRVLYAVVNKTWKQHLTKQQLYGHLPPILQTIKAK